MTKSSITESPALPPKAGTNLEQSKAPQPLMNPSTTPCASLTVLAIQQIIDKIEGSRDKAQNDVTVNGISGVYASAANDNLTYLLEAYDKIAALQSWLASNNLDSPYVTNASAAYNIYGYIRESIISLQNARHWAMISVVYHKNANAHDSFELTSHALELAEALGAQAGRCYMSAYYP